jgi:hypothetical protein
MRVGTALLKCAIELANVIRMLRRSARLRKA